MMQNVDTNIARDFLIELPTTVLMDFYREVYTAYYSDGLFDIELLAMEIIHQRHFQSPDISLFSLSSANLIRLCGYLTYIEIFDILKHLSTILIDELLSIFPKWSWYNILRRVKHDKNILYNM